MAIYAIIPLGTEVVALEKRIKKLSRPKPVVIPTQSPPSGTDNKFIEEAYWDYSPKIYFVVYQGTAKELCDAIGYSTNAAERIGSGIVLHVQSYFGIANPNLWDWIRIYG